MDKQILIGAGAAFMALISLGGVVYSFLYGRRDDELRNLLKVSRGDGQGKAGDVRQRVEEDLTGREYERLKKIQKKQLKSSKNNLTLDQRYFQAGIFTERDKREFQRLRILIPIISTPLMAAMMWVSTYDIQLVVVGAVVGILFGLKAPSSILERRVRWRSEDIMFFLPLVIEQIAIGVSSSLDIGPCIQRVVAMADERDSHNVVTELLRYCLYHVKSGASLEEALTEIGTQSGQQELKHSFMALAQTAKHGGEISKQLQELADSVASQRETKIEAKIKKLELEATGPVALVFLGFILILLIGFGIQLKGAF